MTSSAEVTSPDQDLIPLETRKLISLYIGVIVHPPIFLLGLLGNLISICVFLRIGLKDSISVCLFAISCADLICVVFMILAEYSLLLSKFFVQQWRVEGDTLSSLIMFYYGPIYDISQGITTFLAVQKCWCVALPFRFKNTFTKTRTAFVVAGIVVVCVSLCVPVLASHGLQESLEQAGNTTLFKLTTSQDRAQVMSFRSTVAVVTTTTCQTTVTVCLVVLASSLRKSSKFRDATNYISSEPSPAGTGTTKRLAVCLGFLKTFDKQTNSVLSTANEHNASATFGKSKIALISCPRKSMHRKEMKAIKATAIISVIFVVCTTPKLLFFYTILCVPEFNILGRYENTYFIANTMRYTFEAFNISCNIFVYLSFNTRFRSTLKSLFSRRSTK